MKTNRKRKHEKDLSELRQGSKNFKVDKNNGYNDNQIPKNKDNSRVNNDNQIPQKKDIKDNKQISKKKDSFKIDNKQISQKKPNNNNSFKKNSKRNKDDSNLIEFRKELPIWQGN